MTFQKTLLTSALVGITLNQVYAQDFSQTIFFGDSLTDSGYYHPITKNLNTPSGAFTTNPDPVWSKVLAGHLGGSANPNGNGQIGTNYAIGGAKSATEETNAELGGIPIHSAKTQVANHLSTHKTDPNALYTVWIGANDLLQTGANANTITAAAQNTAHTVNTLHHAGAKYILVPNLPDVGLTPRAIGTNLGTQATLAAQVYNQTLYQTLAQTSQANVIALDTFTLLQEVAKNPASFGFSNTTDVACLTPTSLLCNKNTVKPNADGYLFADDIHPSGAAHQAIGDYAYATLQAPSQIGQISQQLISQEAANNLINTRLNKPLSGSNWWLIGTLNHTKYHADKHHTKTDNPSHTVRVGADLNKDSHSFGAYLKQSKQDNTQPQGGFDITATGLGVYHQKRFGRTHLNTQISLDKLNVKTQRNITLGTHKRTHHAKANGHQASAELQAGYQFGSYTPFVGVNIQHVKIGQLVEDEPVLATSMRFDKQNHKEAFIKTGVLVNQPLNHTLTLTGHLGINHRLINDEQTIQAGLQSIKTANNFTIPIKAGKKTYGDLGVGVHASLGATQLHAQIQAQIADKDNHHLAGSVGIERKF